MIKQIINKIKRNYLVAELRTDMIWAASQHWFHFDVSRGHSLGCRRQEDIFFLQILSLLYFLQLISGMEHKIFDVFFTFL